MSADNAIAILATRDRHIIESSGKITSFGEDGTPVWRVAHLQNPEEFDLYRETELHTLGAWMYWTFSDSPVFLTKEAAFDHAISLEKEKAFVEHGIIEYDARDLNFPGS